MMAGSFLLHNIQQYSEYNDAYALGNLLRECSVRNRMMGKADHWLHANCV